MTIFKIETPQEFFEHIVSTDVSEFLKREPGLRTAYHACNSLHSYRDWIAETYKGKTWCNQGKPQPPISGKHKFMESLESITPDFGVISDIANASKHMVLRPDGVRAGMAGNADTQIEEFDGTVGEAPVNTVPIGGSIRNIYVRIGTQRRDVTFCIRTVYETWKGLNAENSW